MTAYPGSAKLKKVRGSIYGQAINSELTADGCESSKLRGLPMMSVTAKHELSSEL
jgi:hypothetical protein